jgi:hypothetical protein
VGYARAVLERTVVLPGALVQAVNDTLEHEQSEPNPARRFLLLNWTRVTLGEWRQGLLTTEHAIDSLLVWRQVH